MSRRMMPTLGSNPQQNSPPGRRMATIVLMVLAGAFGYWLRGKHISPLPRQGFSTTSPATPGGLLGPATSSPAMPGAASPGIASAPVANPSAPTATGPDALRKQSHLKLASIHINGPLETSLAEAAGTDEAPALAQVVTRALVWWLQVPGDFRKGDKLDVLFEERSGAEPIVHAVRLESAKLGKVFRAYRFQAPGDTFPRYYQPSGEELELRLKTSPLDDYEQITSLIKDGRRHKGVDFKTPTGSPVKATFAGTITRKNWNFHGNGNCLEITEAGGRHKAMFLHLSELPKTEKVGEHVVVGQVIAHSGNSGHSFAPHLHYQLMADEKVLDPFEVHPSYRRSLSPDRKPALDAEINRLDALMGPAVASN